MSLRERHCKKMKDYYDSPIATNQTVNLSREQYRERLNDLCLQVSDFALLQAGGAKGVPHEDVKAAVKKVLENERGGGIRNKADALHRDFSRALGAYEQARDIYAQEAKADKADRWRYFWFRMLTGFGIAALILLTSWVAKCLEIPLPTQRVGIYSAVTPDFEVQPLAGKSSG